MKIDVLRHFFVINIVISLLFAVGVEAATGPGKPPIFRHTLANGLEIIVKPDHRSPVAAVMVWYRAG
ncbi:MAG: insulinase family protein, partial [Betaproteobacteria bacterium]|nr:insulinase family protein [Betaproteobacteria bacterium]